MGDARGQLTAAQGRLKDLENELVWIWDAVKRADERTAVAESRCDEVSAHLSSLEEIRRERDEVVAQRDDAWSECEVLRADRDNAQAQFETVKSQREEALARVIVLEQELSKRIEDLKGLTLATEELKLQNQQLCQEVKVLDVRCSALLEDAKLTEDKVRLACEERLQEYKGSVELKAEIDQACQRCLQEYKDSSELQTEIRQACEDHLQRYKDSPELKTKIEEACEERLAEFKASDTMKNEIWHRAFCMFASRFNQGLKEARDAPSTPLARL
ncbi:uncharacterized protein LOC110600578 [Manihot esculenta]|uniref:uncharacterized protein LOC110600578 n=1 Tax=Manihot esculenta TaxID=3983 RepID=UPI000B5D7563|nr:uncharacterized protein LOC110600578 [Manihot esculenta]